MSHYRGWRTKRLRRDCARRGRWLWRLVETKPLRGEGERSQGGMGFFFITARIETAMPYGF